MTNFDESNANNAVEQGLCRFYASIAAYYMQNAFLCVNQQLKNWYLSRAEKHTKNYLQLSEKLYPSCLTQLQ